jgi:hypothetical protein
MLKTMSRHIVANSSAWLVAALLLPHHSVAIEADPVQKNLWTAERDAQCTEHSDNLPNSGLSVMHHGRRQWEVLSIYDSLDFPGGTPTQHWIFRKISNNKTAPVWADSRNCPAITSILTDARRLGSPDALLVRPPVDRAVSSLVSDGSDYKVWTRNGVQSDGSRVRVTQESNAGPVAEWSAMALRALQPCWRTAVPFDPRRGSRRR